MTGATATYEVSVNQRDWEVVCDRNQDPCRSWQLHSSEARGLHPPDCRGLRTRPTRCHCVLEAPGSGGENVQQLTIRHSGEMDDAEVGRWRRCDCDRLRTMMWCSDKTTRTWIILLVDAAGSSSAPAETPAAGIHDPSRFPWLPVLLYRLTLPLGAAPPNTGTGPGQSGALSNINGYPCNNSNSSKEPSLCQEAIPRSVRGVRREIINPCLSVTWVWS